MGTRWSPLPARAGGVSAVGARGSGRSALSGPESSSDQGHLLWDLELGLPSGMSVLLRITVPRAAPRRDGEQTFTPGNTPRAGRRRLPTAAAVNQGGHLCGAHDGPVPPGTPCPRQPPGPPVRVAAVLSVCAEATGAGRSLQMSRWAGFCLGLRAAQGHASLAPGLRARRFRAFLQDARGARSRAPSRRGWRGDVSWAPAPHACGFLTECPFLCKRGGCFQEDGALGGLSQEVRTWL